MQNKREIKQLRKGIKKTRKSMHQKLALEQFYKDLQGETPSKETISDLSLELNLTENQVYKWFWDTNKRVDQKHDAPQQQSEDSSQNIAMVSRAISQAQNCKDEFEELAIHLGLDIQGLANEVLDEESPRHTR